MALIAEAIQAGMHADLNSGNSYYYVVIKEEGAKKFDRNVPEFSTAQAKSGQFSYFRPFCAFYGTAREVPTTGAGY